MEPRLAHQYPEPHCQENPGQIAVIDGGQEMSFRELAALSDKLCRCLETRGIRRHDRVAICMQRTVMCIPAILGTLKADAVYVPLDPKAPLERWGRIIKDCTPGAFLCDSFTAGKVAEALSGRKGTPVISLDHRRATGVPRECVPMEEVASHDGSKRVYENRDDDIAYVMYTSGSTGQPKGVMISHRNIKTYINWAVNCFGIDRQDRILSTAPFHFDMSTFDIYCSLKAGATLCIAPDNMVLFPEKVFGFIEQHEATLWKGVSSLLMYMEKVGAVRAGRIPSMRKILFAGENLPTKYLIRWMESFPGITFYNAYGPTETTGVSMYFQVKDIPGTPHERIPIGIPRHDTPVWLLDENKTPVKAGETGELFIGGNGVSKGYLNDPERTLEVFVDNPVTRDQREILYATGDLARLRDDGNYEFIGRKDRQVKIMGHRVELGEIEHALLSHRQVKDCAVVAVASEKGEFDELVGFLEMENGSNSRDVIAFVQGKLPPYMVPKRLVEVDVMPLNDRGKIDRKALIDRFLESK